MSAQPIPDIDNDAMLNAAWDAALARVAVHEVRWTMECEQITGTMICHGNPGDACRVGCEQGQCETYRCEHMPTPLAYCNVVEFSAAGDGPLYDYEGSETRVRDGLVSVRWDGDNYLWKYADGQS